MNIDQSSIEAFLRSWLPNQRWFLAPDDTTHESVGESAPSGSADADDLHDAPAQGGSALPNAPVRIANLTVLAQSSDSTILFLLVEAGEHLYTVPIIHGHQSANSSAAVPEYCDATDTPEGRAALLAATLTPGGNSYDMPHSATHGKAQGDTSQRIASLQLYGTALHETYRDLPEIVTSHKLTSEQSNTSIIYKLADGRSVIVKLLRLVHPGINPDIELQCALDNAGSAVVPAQYGYARAHFSSAGMDISGSTPDEHEYEYKEYEADVLTASEFLDGSVDAWQLITGELSASGRFPISAIAQLGHTTRAMHTALANALPTAAPDDDARIAQLTSWRARAAQALDRVPELQPYAARIEDLYTRAASAAWPQLQRIHGDFHLGQVLRTHSKNEGPTQEKSTSEWRIIDFEGEPLRPLSERNKPDLALRDISGMLRSLSYAAGFARKNGADPALVTEWENAARTEFLRAYGVEKSELADALILDKALYEVMYEAAYRPPWINIPLAGIAEIMSTQT